jgi:hypothetical protein
MRRIVASLLAAAVLLPAAAQAAAAEAPPPPGMEAPAMEAPAMEAPVMEAPLMGPPAAPPPPPPAPAPEAAPAPAPAVGGCLTVARTAWFDAEFAWIDAQLAAVHKKLDAEIAARVKAIQLRSGLGMQHLAALLAIELWDLNATFNELFGPSRITLVNAAVATGAAVLAQDLKVEAIEATIIRLHAHKHALELYRMVLEHLRAALGVGVAFGEAAGGAVCPLFVPPARPEVEP